jgi:hypothetical protein
MPTARRERYRAVWLQQFSTLTRFKTQARAFVICGAGTGNEALFCVISFPLPFPLHHPELKTGTNPGSYISGTPPLTGAVLVILILAAAA